MKHKFNAALAIVLCLVLLTGSFAIPVMGSAYKDESPGSSNGAPVSLGSVSDGPEEVIYGRLDNRGRPRSAYAVVELSVAAPGKISHHGQYTEVENLTDTSPIEYSNGIVTLEAERAGLYYYQGKLRKALMPWDIEITYKLDGKELDPDDLSGASGELEVDIHTSINSGFDPYFADNYMLQISVTLDSELCEDISARNGTVASAGSSKNITFVVLPGSEGDVGFSAKVHDFSMGGFTIAGVLYNQESMMSGMGEEIDGITSGISQLTGAISTLAGAAGQLRDGAGELDENGGTLSEASGQIYEALSQIAEGLEGFDMSEMGEGLEQLGQLPDAFFQLGSGLNQIGEGIDQLLVGYQSIASGLQEALDQMGPMFEMMDNEQLMALLQKPEQLNTLMALAGDEELMAILQDTAKVAALKELAGDDELMAMLTSMDEGDIAMLKQLAQYMDDLVGLMQQLPPGTDLGELIEKIEQFLPLITGGQQGGFPSGGFQPDNNEDPGNEDPDKDIDAEDTTDTNEGTGEPEQEPSDEPEPELSDEPKQEPSEEPEQEPNEEPAPAAETAVTEEDTIDVQLMSSSSSSGFGDFDLGDFGSLEDMMANMPAAPGEDASALDKFQYMVDMLDFLNECLGMISGILTEMGDQLILAGMEMADSMEGLTDFDLDAVTELQEGMVLLADNYGEFNEGLGLYLEGVAAVAEGLDGYASGMYALNSETQAIPDMVDALLGTGDEKEEESGPVSFLSEENEDTAAVQFVLSTEGIAAPEAEEEPAPPAEEEQGFFGDLWDKVVNLF